MRRCKRPSSSRSNGFPGNAVDANYVSGSEDEDDEVELVDEAGQLLEGPSNEEIASLLESKTVPERGTKRRRTGASKSMSSAATPAAEPSASTSGSQEAGIVDISKRPIAGNSTRRSNPIYHFYETWKTNANGEPGEKGDKHYRCRHGNRKILTVTKKMNYSIVHLVGLTGHLKTHFPDHFTLYEMLHNREQQPTEDEIAMATGKKEIRDQDTLSHLAALDKRRTTLDQYWSKQAQAQALPFDQKQFETLLVKWIIACDHAFSEVEKPEFRALLEYLHTRGVLKIPARSTIAERVKEMGKTTIAETKQMIKDLKCDKVSLTLDAWTSSNQLAFLAIIMTYVSNIGKLEEMLIEFKEIIGQHSGQNMGDIVWKSMCDLGLQGKVIALMMDNASNNDTLMEHLAAKHRAIGLSFDPRHARLRCMPHTIHLAATKLLEGIGAFKKKRTRGVNYQETVNTPMSNAADDYAAQFDDEDDEDEIPSSIEPSELILYAVPKLRRIIRSVRGSPQSRKNWLLTATEVINRLEAAAAEEDDAERALAVGLDPPSARSRASSVASVSSAASTAQSIASAVPSEGAAAGVQRKELTPKLRALMLILDVVTRWSSSHQMIERALAFKVAIDKFSTQDDNLRQFRLSPDDWEAVAIVERWLRSFRAATLQMSSTKRPMLSSVHAIFRGLQQSLRDNLTDLPASCNVRLKQSIIDAHRKLSDYYWKFDTGSPFYLWAAMLDPRIMYDGLLDDTTDEPGMTADDLARAKDALREYFDLNYPERREQAPAQPQQAPIASTTDFTARYAQKARKVTDELEEFWRRVQEPWGSDPIWWWFNRRTEFPRLSRMALDILSIPGSAVAVERVFSGGRDTVSIRRASLSAETIRFLMLIKQALRRARDVIELD